MTHRPTLRDDEATAIAVLAADRYAAAFERDEVPFEFNEDMGRIVARLAEQRLDEIEPGWRVRVNLDEQARRFVFTARWQS